MTFTLYMVRHGQTILNSYNRLQGWCDSPLTEKAQTMPTVPANISKTSILMLLTVPTRRAP